VIQTLTINDWLPTMSANGSHEHWSKAKKKHDVDMQTTWASAKYAGWQRFSSKVRVTIILYFAQRRSRDTDNLYYRCKGVVDGIKDFCVDDSTQWMELIVAEQLVLPLAISRKATEITMETLE